MRISFKLFVMTVFLFNLLQTYVFASSQIVAEKKAGGFHYRIIADGEILTWSIGDGKKQSELQEGKKNQRELDQFREAVNEMSVQKFSLIIYILYLTFIGIMGYILYKKVAKKREELMAIVTLFAMYAIYKSYMAYEFFVEAQWDAKYYLAVLT
ncbi:hypothetical protein [Fictibacillus phosphorivorans]|uniref:hypothetical protein n=1 Tax=Fictibacillus phosphorivorans TaxID=1221500 RepID=UPI001292D96C|nr:hypothetical protein [Fictibacillus phosphorivorans]MQR95690.1 hypothetical protein [Fictibacillus phosphorivorans]